MNGKGEEIPVDGDGIAVSKLLSKLGITEFSKVRIVSDDAYSAEVNREEVVEGGKVVLLLEEGTPSEKDTLRLVVFGDENSKRSVSNVVEINIE